MDLQQVITVSLALFALCWRAGAVEMQAAPRTTARRQAETGAKAASVAEGRLAFDGERIARPGASVDAAGSSPTRMPPSVQPPKSGSPRSERIETLRPTANGSPAARRKTDAWSEFKALAPYAAGWSAGGMLIGLLAASTALNPILGIPAMIAGAFGGVFLVDAVKRWLS